jgi:hypothetical protein
MASEICGFSGKKPKQLLGLWAKAPMGVAMKPQERNAKLSLIYWI